MGRIPRLHESRYAPRVPQTRRWRATHSVAAEDTLRPVAAKLALPRLSSAAVANRLGVDGQMGRMPLGTQKVYASVPEQVQAGMWVLSIDIENAFNSIERPIIYGAREGAVRAPHKVGGQRQQEQDRGTTGRRAQACPLSPLLFAVTVQNVTRAAIPELHADIAASINNQGTHFYADGG